LRFPKNFQRRKCIHLPTRYEGTRSVGGQIAEAWGKRRYEKHFESKLTDADAEQLETQHWIQTALDCSYISKETANDLLQQYFSLGKMLNSMINKSELFCNILIGN